MGKEEKSVVEQVPESVSQRVVDDRMDRDQFARDIEFARMQQEMLQKTAPEGVKVGGVYESPFDALTKVHMPEAVGKKAKYAVFWALRAQYRDYLARGYIPVPNKITGGPLTYEEHVALYRPREMLEAELKGAAMASRRMLDTSVSPQLDEARREGGDVTTQLKVK